MGFIIGNEIRKNTPERLQPSSVATSSSETGMVNVVVEFEPVKIGSTTVKRCGNAGTWNTIKSKKLGVGSKVKVFLTKVTIPMIAENISKRQQFVDEFSENITNAMAQVQEQIDQIQKSIDEKKSLGVKDRKEIISRLNSVKSNIGANLVFCAKQFDEQMDKTVAEAKGEIEAFCQNKINTIAQSALIENKDQLLQLENPIDMSDEI